jgi:hypothetical protein
MNVNWTPEPAHWRHPKNAHERLAWALWISSAVLVVTWIALMAAGHTMNGKVHLLLAGFAALQLFCILLGFKYFEYLEPMKAARARILRWRTRRVSSRDGWHDVKNTAPVSPDEHMDARPGQTSNAGLAQTAIQSAAVASPMDAMVPPVILEDVLLKPEEPADEKRDEKKSDL